MGDFRYYLFDIVNPVIVCVVDSGQIDALVAVSEANSSQRELPADKLPVCVTWRRGQICLPGSIPITLSSVLPRQMGSGSWKYHGMAGYTSVGVGSSIVPVRINCRRKLRSTTCDALECLFQRRTLLQRSG